MDVISNARTVPVQEDLTTEVLTLSILRGMENMHRVDKKLAAGASLVMGEWAVLQADNTLARPGAVPVANTYLVFAGTDRFDSKATGQATIIMSSPIIAKSSRYDTSVSYAVGDALTVKDLGGGEAFVTKQAGAEPILAQVIEVGANYLVYSVKA